MSVKFITNENQTVEEILSDKVLFFRIPKNIISDNDLLKLYASQYGIENYQFNWDQFYDVLCGYEEDKFSNINEIVFFHVETPNIPHFSTYLDALLDIQNKWESGNNPRWSERKKRINVSIYFPLRDKKKVETIMGLLK